jgi:hypothetical protein
MVSLLSSQHHRDAEVTSGAPDCRPPAHVERADDGQLAQLFLALDRIEDR